MARVGYNLIWQWNWSSKKSGRNYKLNMICSDNTSSFPVSHTTISMPKNSLVGIEYGYEYDSMFYGLQNTPYLKLKFNVNNTKNATTKFNDIIKDPYRTYNTNVKYAGLESYYLGRNIEVEGGNIFELYIDNSLVFVGMQKNGIEKGYDSSKYIFEVEIWHISRIVSEAIKMEYMNDLKWLDSSYIKETNFAYEWAFIDDSHPYMTNPSLFGLGANAPKLGDNFSYFYFIPYLQLIGILEYYYKSIIKLITRNRVNLDSYATVLNLQFAIQWFKQDYSISQNRGDELNYNDMYILGFVADKSKAQRDSDLNVEILATFIDSLEEYKSFWDFLKVFAKQNFLKIFTQFAYFNSELLLVSSSLNITANDFKERPKITIESETIKRSSGSFVETYDNDLTNIEKIKQSGRSEKSDSTPIIFNNFIANRKEVGENSYVISYVGDFNDYFSQFKINSIYTTEKRFLIRHFKPHFLKIYYFDTPAVVSQEMPFGSHWNSNILLGDGNDSDSINNMNSEYTFELLRPLASLGLTNGYISAYDVTIRTIRDTQSYGSIGACVGRSAIKIFNSNNYLFTEISDLKIKSWENLNDYFIDIMNGNELSLNFDFDLLSPKNDTTFLNNINSKIFINQLSIDLTCNFSENDLSECFILNGFTVGI